MSAGASFSAAIAALAVTPPAVTAISTAAAAPCSNTALIASPRFRLRLPDHHSSFARSRPQKNLGACLTGILSRNSSRLAVIDAIRPHVGRRGHAVGHVEEAGDRGDVPNVAVAEPGPAQRLAIVAFDQPRLGGELHREVEHGALAL